MSEELKTYDVPVDHGDFTAIVEQFYLKSDADAVIAGLKTEIHNLKRSLIVARHEVAKARGKTSSYKSKTKLKEARRCCMNMYRDSWKNSGLSR